MKQTHLLAIGACATVVVLLAAYALLVYYPSPTSINGILPISNDTNLASQLLSNPKINCSSGGIFEVLLNFSCVRGVVINSVSAYPPGFDIVSTNCSFPLTVNGITAVLLDVKAPTKGYQGILYLNMTVSNLPVENFTVPSFVSDWKKSVTSFTVYNNGAIPVEIANVSLYRSDGIFANSTAIPLQEIQPSQATTFNISLYYAPATAQELYYIKVESVNGVTAVSTVSIPITCNCTHS